MLKFEIIKEDSETNARMGILTIKNKKINTPNLWLGCLTKNRLFPWEYFDVNTIMVNAYEIIKGNIAIESIHKFLKTDGLVMMDSGGFQLYKKRVKVSPDEILEIYKQTEPDIGVILDHPLNPSHLDMRFEKWKKTLDNTIYMLNNANGTILMPVIHGYTIKEVKKACKELKEIIDPQIIGIGSLVPIIRSIKSSSLTKLNHINSIDFMVKIISVVRKEFPDSFLHTFGIGGTTTMHFLFGLGVDSVDSMSWRMKAAYGAIQLPGIGDRFIAPKSDRGRTKLKENSLLKSCNCPICSGKSLKERKGFLDNSKKDTFSNRAVHNAYTFKEEEKLFHKAFEESNLLKFLRNRLRKTRYYKSLETYLNNRNETIV